MKRIISVLLAATLLCTLITACSSSDNATTSTTPANSSASGAPSTPASGDAAKPDKVYELSFTMHDSAQSDKGIVYTDWCNKINEATNGAVNVTLFAGGTLAAADQALDVMRSGACDIAFIFTSYTPEVFPLSDVITLPMMGIKSSEAGVNVLWDLYDTVPQMKAEYDDYKLIHMYPNPINYLNFSEKKVDSLDTLKGLKIRVSGGAATDIMTLFGAAPISMATSDLYEAVEKHVLDGYLSNGSGIASWKLQELTKYFVDMPIYCGPFLVMMNKASWDKLPADIQGVIDEYCGREPSLEIGRSLDASSEKGYADMVAAGQGEWVTVGDAEYDKFYDIAYKYNSEWAGEHTTADFDAQAYLDKALELATKY